MPSDTAVAAGSDLGDLMLGPLQPRVEAFRSAVATAEEEVRAYVTQQQGRSSVKGEQALIELGPFAVGRIDPERFAMLIGHVDDELTPEAFDVLDRADAVLRDFSVATDLHRVRLEAGGDLRDAVKDALADVGRVFGASRAVELARDGAFDAERHGHLLGPLPFRLWNRAERQLAPPLIVDLRGEDCFPAGLGEFLDGAVTIVLATSGPATPAPLARLITPGTFVMQTSDPAELERVAQTRHPAVAMVFDEARPEQAHFVHDPDAGDTTWSRLSVQQMPDEADVGRGRRAPTWLEEVVHLRTLAARPKAVAHLAGSGENGVGDGSAAAEVTSADQLAGWLLAQTELGDL